MSSASTPVFRLEVTCPTHFYSDICGDKHARTLHIRVVEAATGSFTQACKNITADLDVQLVHAATGKLASQMGTSTKKDSKGKVSNLQAFGDFRMVGGECATSVRINNNSTQSEEKKGWKIGVSLTLGGGDGSSSSSSSSRSSSSGARRSSSSGARGRSGGSGSGSGVGGKTIEWLSPPIEVASKHKQTICKHTCNSRAHARTDARTDACTHVPLSHSTHSLTTHSRTIRSPLTHHRSLAHHTRQLPTSLWTRPPRSRNGGSARRYRLLVGPTGRVACR